MRKETNHKDQSVESARKRDGDWTAKSNNKASQRKSCKTKSTDESVVSVLIRRGKKQTTKIKVWEVSEREMEIGQQNPITKPVNVRVAKLKVQMKV